MNVDLLDLIRYPIAVSNGMCSGAAKTMRTLNRLGHPAYQISVPRSKLGKIQGNPFSQTGLKNIGKTRKFPAQRRMFEEKSTFSGNFLFNFYHGSATANF
jgi:hypothetical protein